MATGDPIKLGSSAASTLVPEPGWEIATNDFGTDVVTLSYAFGNLSTANTTGVRPKRGDAYSGSLTALSGFLCDSSTVIGGEGLTAKLRAVYMKPNPNFVRVISVSSTVQAVRSTFSGAGNLILFPQPVVKRRYSSDHQEYGLGSQLGQTQALSIGFPDILGNSNNVEIPGASARFSYNSFWSNTGLVSEPKCAKAFLEIEETWTVVTNIRVTTH